MSKQLAEKDVEYLLAALEDGTISEDEDDIGDENELDYYPNVQSLRQELEDDQSDDEEQSNEDPPLAVEEESGVVDDQLSNSAPGPSSNQPLSSILGAAAWRQRSRELIWKKRNFVYSEDLVRFLGNSDLSPQLTALDMAVINSWVLYKKNNPNMTLGDFRSELAECLCTFKKNNDNKRGRPSSSFVEREIEAKKRRGPMKPVLPKDVRMDGIGHDEKRCSSKNRCKLPGCKGFSRTECTKCMVALCHTKDRNCFAIFHSK